MAGGGGDPLQVFGFEPDLLRLIFRGCGILRLPDLAACRCVCRGWRDYLDGANFIEVSRKEYLIDCWNSGYLESADLGM